jgi:hypothetical protein
MTPYTVVWSGEIEKREHDQQIRPAPPIEEKRVRVGDGARMTPSEERLFVRLLGIGRASRSRKKVR